MVDWRVAEVEVVAEVVAEVEVVTEMEGSIVAGWNRHHNRNGAFDCPECIGGIHLGVLCTSSDQDSRRCTVRWSLRRSGIHTPFACLQSWNNYSWACVYQYS